MSGDCVLVFKLRVTNNTVYIYSDSVDNRGTIYNVYICAAFDAVVLHSTHIDKYSYQCTGQWVIISNLKLIFIPLMDTHLHVTVSTTKMSF